MAPPITFARILFGLLSHLFMIAYMIAYPLGSMPLKVLIGICLGAAFTLILFSLDTLFRKFSLRIFNTVIIGLFFGYLLGKGLVLLFDSITQISALTISMSPSLLEVLKIALFLCGTYLGTILTLKFENEIHMHIPFVRFNQTAIKKKDVILDLNAISDNRIIDFCTSGILNNQVILPRFLLKELTVQAESIDESTKIKAKRALEIVKKLEALPQLGLRFSDVDFPETRELTQKILKLARTLEANILTFDQTRTQSSTTDGILSINLNTLSHSLKPLTPPGETITIKVQRYGKEPKQGVGYLEDGTMVVINNGGDFIGEVIETQVISVKQTSAGRIIFTNALVLENEYNHPNHQHMYEHQHVYEHQHE